MKSKSGKVAIPLNYCEILFFIINFFQSRTLRPSWKQQRAGLRQIVWSVMMPLILANTSRIAALNVGAYNITLYMAEYFPDFNVAFLGWVTLVSSFPGSIFGGLLCDILRRTSGIRGRLWLSLVLMVRMMMCRS